MLQKMTKCAIIKSVMDKFIKFFVGKKTYIVGVLMIALGLIQGDNQMVLTGIGFITLRAAV